MDSFRFNFLLDIVVELDRIAVAKKEKMVCDIVSNLLANPAFPGKFETSSASEATLGSGEI